MASIEKRGEYTYRITVSNGYDRNNKKITKKKTVTLDAKLKPKEIEKELQRLAHEFETKIKGGDIFDELATFEQFVYRWLDEYAEKRLEAKTVHSYKEELEKKILPALGHIKLSQLKPYHLIKYYDNLTQDGVRLDNKKGGYSERTIKYQHQIISSILQTAVYWQVLEENVARRVSPPKGVKTQNKNNFFNLEEANAFLEFIEDKPLKYRAIIYLALYGGMRLGECLGLTWEDIDFDNNSIVINKALSLVGGKEIIKGTKNDGSTRTITMSKSVMRILLELKLQTQGNMVFKFYYATPNHWLQKTINTYNDKNDFKLPKISFHGLRHTSATLLVSQGLDIKTVARRLGHTDETMLLKVYAHYLQSKDETATTALDNILHIKR